MSIEMHLIVTVVMIFSLVICQIIVFILEFIFLFIQTFPKI